MSRKQPSYGTLFSLRRPDSAPVVIATEAGAPGKWVPVSFMLFSSLISYMDRGALAVLAPMILLDTGMTTSSTGSRSHAFRSHT